MRAIITKTPWLRRPPRLPRSPPLPLPGISARPYHSTSARKINPLLLFFGRIGALYAGRSARTAYQKMSPEQKRYFWKRNGKIFAGMSGTVGLCGGGFIASHYEQAPVTGRWRLLLYNHEVEVQMGDHATEEILSTMKRPNDKKARGSSIPDVSSLATQGVRSFPTD